MTAKRIQQRRSKGWRNPAGAVAVGRGTKWGTSLGGRCARHPPGGRRLLQRVDGWRAPRAAGVAARRCELARRIAATAGRDLMCWCKPEDLCHADILIELA